MASARLKARKSIDGIRAQHAKRQHHQPGHRPHRRELRRVGDEHRPPQLLRKRRRRLIAGIGLLAQRALNDAIQRDDARRAAEGGRLVLQNGGRDVEDGRAAERPASGHHLVEHDAEREQIAADVDFVAFDLLGRHVARRADDEPGLGQCPVDRSAPGERPGDPEVEQLDPVFRQKHIRRLQVAVHDPGVVQSSERAEHRQRDLRRLRRRQRAAFQPRAQRLPVEQFHRQEQLGAVLFDLVQLTDIRMADAGRGAGLPPQAAPLELVGALADPLDRHRAIQALVVGGMNDAHPALSELSPHAVAGQRTHGPDCTAALRSKATMPFKSKAQRRKFAELLVQGKISNETFEEWNRDTGGRKLPERVKRKTAKVRRKRKRTRT